MNYRILSKIFNGKEPAGKSEARILCDLNGERFDEMQYQTLSKMEPWERTLSLYREDCKERGVSCLL